MVIVVYGSTSRGNNYPICSQNVHMDLNECFTVKGDINVMDLNECFNVNADKNAIMW